MRQRAIYLDDVMSVQGDSGLITIAIRAGAYQYRCCMATALATALHQDLTAALLRASIPKRPAIPASANV